MVQTSSLVALVAFAAAALAVPAPVAHPCPLADGSQSGPGATYSCPPLPHQTFNQRSDDIVCESWDVACIVAGETSGGNGHFHNDKRVAEPEPLPVPEPQLTPCGKTFCTAGQHCCGPDYGCFSGKFCPL